MATEMLIVAHHGDGWYVVLLAPSILYVISPEFVNGPYATHQEAVDAAQSRAWRISQGWVP